MHSQDHRRPYTSPLKRTDADPSLRRKMHGPIQPMDEKPSFLRRLFRW